MVFDFKKEYKEFYMPKNKPAIVTIPKMNYIAVRGKGNPNDEGGEYQRSIELLYGIAYTIKMSYRSSRKIKGFLSILSRLLKAFGGKMAAMEWTMAIKKILNLFLLSVYQTL